MYKTKLIIGNTKFRNYQINSFQKLIICKNSYN